MTQEPIQDCRRRDLIIEYLTPVREALVAGHSQTPTFIAADQQSDEQTGLGADNLSVNGQITF